MLAGLVKAPSAYDPAGLGQQSRRWSRRNYVIDRMVDLGYLPPEMPRRRGGSRSSCS